MQERKNIDVIQAFRGVAALSVVLYHYSWFISPLDQSFLRHGYFGVDLFFMISGFLAYITARNFSGGVHDSFIYLTKRATRIIPTYYIVTIAYFVTYWAMGLPNENLLLNTLKSLLFIPLNGGVAPAFGYALVESGWTLNYEFFLSNGCTCSAVASLPLVCTIFIFCSPAQLILLVGGHNA